MEITKLFDLENDGLNMVVDEQFLYIRCMKDMYKYNLSDMNLAAHNTVFKKDGKARGFSIFGEYIFLYDFLDLYIMGKCDLQVIDSIRLGVKLSSDVGGVMDFDSQIAYVSIRNGRMDSNKISLWDAQTLQCYDMSLHITISN